VCFDKSVPPCDVQAGGLTLWVKRTDVAGARYGSVRSVDTRLTVDEFIARWTAQAKLDVDPSLVTLRLVNAAGVDPTAEEEKQAIELRPRLSLDEAGITDGCSLLAFIASSAPRSPCAVSICAADSGHATGLGTVLPVDAPPPPGVCTACARAL
jgi:hypothetical protein